MTALTKCCVAETVARDHLCLHRNTDRQAKPMIALQSIRSFFGVFRAAIHAAAAVEMHRSPDAHDLRKLGIPKSAFRQIHL
jgi:hypothetical protein